MNNEGRKSGTDVNSPRLGAGINRARVIGVAGCYLRLAGVSRRRSDPALCAGSARLGPGSPLVNCLVRSVSEETLVAGTPRPHANSDTPPLDALRI